MDFKIRRARTEDASALMEILRNVGWFQHMQEEPGEVTLARVARHLRMCLAADCHSVYIAQALEEDILGYVSVHWLPYLFLPGPEGYILELFVRDISRHQGIGSALLKTVIEEAHRRGCSRLSLLNRRERQSYQDGFYKNRGWEERPDMANFIINLAEVQNQ